MSYTCPSCLWTSHNPHDKIANYCGHCHEFQDSDFNPTTFQVEMIRALRGPSPVEDMKLAVAAYRLEGVEDQERPWSAILIELMPFLGANRLTLEQYAAVIAVIREVTAMSFAIE